jgi:hypothetical protein
MFAKHNVAGNKRCGSVVGVFWALEGDDRIFIGERSEGSRRRATPMYNYYWRKWSVVKELICL